MGYSVNEFRSDENLKIMVFGNLGPQSAAI